MKIWVCRQQSCGHIVVADEKPNPMKWTDGHICYFVEKKEEIDCDVCQGTGEDDDYTECHNCGGTGKVS